MEIKDPVPQFAEGAHVVVRPFERPAYSGTVVKDDGRMVTVRCALCGSERVATHALVTPSC